MTDLPPASPIDSGYVVQYGAGSSASSPSSSSAANVWYTACLPPLVTSTWSAVTWYPESRAVLAAMAERSSGRPAAGVYLCILGSAAARSAASTVQSGGGKSGSQAP